MNKTRVLQEIKRMKFHDIFNRWTEKRLTQQEAAMMLGICERTFRRHCRAFEQEPSIDAIVDRRIDRKAHNAAPLDEVIALLNLYQTNYPLFTIAHFFDKYRDKHSGQRSYNWVRKHLQQANIIKPAKKRGAHRRKRQRASMKGMRLHQDGSTHQWVNGQYWDLIVTLDDATNEVYSGFFVEQEGTHSSFQAVKEVITQHGLFCSLYTDRGSHYWHTPKAGGKVDRNNPTQFGRAMNQLGIEMIPAYSPEARGRSERLFRTLQDRLTKELALNNITDKPTANAFLNDTYWPQHNRRFAREPQEKESAFIPWLSSGMNLQDILSIQEKRTVNNDNTISYRGKFWQIPKQTHRYSYHKANVRVHEYQDQSIAIFHGPRCLARFDNQGHLLQKDKVA